MRRDAFSSVHPAVELAFFLAVTLVTAFVLHPVITGISLVSAFIYSVWLKGKKALRFNAFFVLPVLLAAAILNPVFNHEGATVLFYFKNGNAVTLEAVLYGVNSGCMFAALIMWFSCLDRVMSADKYTYLFGGAIPALSLVFSMVLRFVPGFMRRIKEVSEAQRSLAPEPGKGPVKAAKHGLSVLSLTTTWALEKAVTVSDSMRSRGYGTGRRTSFRLYRFDTRDLVLTLLLVLCFVPSVYAMATKHIRFRFYPSIKSSGPDAVFYLGCAAFLTLCSLPILLEIKEAVEWRILRSRL